MTEFFTKYWKLLITIVIASLILYAQVTYLISLYKRKVRPAFLSWLGWAILMGISFIGQFVAKGWTIKIIALLISTIGCFIIGLSAWLIFRHYSYKKKDLQFLYYGAACILIYFLLEDEWLTTIVAIVADAILAIPTITNAYKKPADERSRAWIFALSSWTLTLILVLNSFTWLHMLWPLYLIAFNGSMIFLAYIRPALQRKTAN